MAGFRLLAALLALATVAGAADDAGHAAAADFYVAPGGDDAWSGTLPEANAARSDGPFATLERARAALRPRIAGASAGLRVLLRGGTWYLPHGLRFEAEDGGTATVA